MNQTAGLWIIFLWLKIQMSGLDYNSMMALKELIAGEDEADLIDNPFKGSSLNPGQINPDSNKKETAKPHAKI